VSRALSSTVTAFVPAQQRAKTARRSPILVGVGAPTSLAIELANDRRMTLCGFAPHGCMNTYTGAANPVDGLGT